MTARDYNDWVNDDGLRITFGTGEAQVGRGGEYSDMAGDVEVVLDIIATDLKAFNDATDPTTVLDYHIRIPEDSFLLSAELVVEVAFAGTNATLDIGLVDASDMSAPFTDLNDAGIDSAIAVTAIDAVGDTIACNGALIGTVLSSDAGGYLISAEAGMASFTAGKAKLIVKYRVPVNSALV